MRRALPHGNCGEQLTGGFGAPDYRAATEPCPAPSRELILYVASGAFDYLRIPSFLRLPRGYECLNIRARPGRF